MLCLQLMRNVRSALRGVSQLGIEIDGTYKIHAGGWTLGVVGTHTTEFKPRKKGAVHSFKPFAYSFMRSESTVGYEVRSCLCDRA